MNVKWAASMRVLRLNSLKHFMNLPGYVQGEMNTTTRIEKCPKRSSVNSIVLVYTNGWIVQDILFTA